MFAERFDWPSIAAANDRLQQALDINLTTVAQAESRADAILRLAATNGEITDPAARLTAAKRRIVALSLRYTTGDRPVYEQRITVGAV